MRELGWTITQAFQVMRPEGVARMVRDVFDAHEFECGLKMLAKEKAERLAMTPNAADKPTGAACRDRSD